MAEHPLQLEEVGCLTGLLLEGALGSEDRSRLEETLLADPAALEYYQDYVDVHCLLHWQHGLPEGRGARDEGRGLAGLPTIDGEAGFGVPLPPASGLQPPASSPEPPFPTLSTTHYPPPTAPFVGSWAFSYMVATVIMGVAILGFWAYKITHHQHIAEAPSQSAPSDARQEMVFVGRITGMVDVKWSDDPRYLPPPGFAHVPLGRKYILDSGLLEITYDSGAKVILQGPCTYEVESTAGGYLSLGKLTARVGEDKETKRQGDKEKKADAASPHLLVSPSPGLPVSPLFSVRTPTALITDLGTEFGVEVDESGVTESHVFQGLVKVQVRGEGRGAGGEGRGAGGEGATAGLSSSVREVVLRANESARVEKGKDADDLHLIIGGNVGASSKFVRQLVRPPRVLDLLDIVAGGNGMGWRRERGIDPDTGMEDPLFAPVTRDNLRRYNLVNWHQLIDGVFIPDGSAGSVKLDSAGHAFDGFPENRNDGAWGSIWSRAAVVTQEKEKLAKNTIFWIYAMGRGEQFMPQGRGLLCLDSNVGITFDLKAMREKFADFRPARFQATAGMVDAHFRIPEPTSMADLWVFVDGRVSFNRMELRPEDGTFDVDVELGPSDRFLTIVVTEGGNTHAHDYLVLGDPVLKLTPVESKKENRTHSGAIQESLPSPASGRGDGI